MSRVSAVEQRIEDLEQRVGAATKRLNSAQEVPAYLQAQTPAYPYPYTYPPFRQGGYTGSTTQPVIKFVESGAARKDREQLLVDILAIDPSLKRFLKENGEWDTASIHTAAEFVRGSEAYSAQAASATAAFKKATAQ